MDSLRKPDPVVDEPRTSLESLINPRSAKDAQSATLHAGTWAYAKGIRNIGGTAAGIFGLCKIQEWWMDSQTVFCGFSSPGGRV